MGDNLYDYMPLVPLLRQECPSRSFAYSDQLKLPSMPSYQRITCVILPGARVLYPLRPDQVAFRLDVCDPCPQAEASEKVECLERGQAVSLHKVVQDAVLLASALNTIVVDVYLSCHCANC